MKINCKLEDIDRILYDSDYFEIGSEDFIVDGSIVNTIDEDLDFYIELGSWNAYIPEINISIRDGVAYQRYEDGEMMADFDVTVLFDGKAEDNILLYWEQDPAGTTLYNFLSCNDVAYYKNFDVELNADLDM